MYTEKDLVLFNWRLFFLAFTTQFLIAYGIHIVSDQKADGRKEARFFFCAIIALARHRKRKFYEYN